MNGSIQVSKEWENYKKAREDFVVGLRAKGVLLESIGRVLKLSKERIRQIEKKGSKK